MILPRRRHLQTLTDRLRHYPVVAILGARQVGKTTLARQLVDGLSGPATMFDLENPRDLARLDDPLLALESLRGLVVLDEIQRRPDLFPVLRVLADRRPLAARFLVLGSAAPDLLRQSSESLAGRIHYHYLGGLTLDEVGVEALERLWVRGGFPASFLARTPAESQTWRQDFIRTFLERDLPQLGVRVPALTLQRFWTMLAHYHGQVWNGSELARAFGVGHPTVRRYLDTLSAALVVRQLQPGLKIWANAKSKPPRFMLPIVACCTACLTSARTTTWSAIPRSAPRGKASPWRKCSPAWAHAPGNASSGRRMPGPSLTCWWFGAPAASGLNSSTPRRRASPRPCAWRCGT